MLDIAFGERKNSAAVESLVNALRPLNLDGSLYVGYPLLSSVEGTLAVDALLTCLQHGVIAFDLSSNGDNYDNGWLQKVESKQNDVFASLSSKLLEYRELRRGRSLAFEVATVTYLPAYDGEESEEALIATPASLGELIHELPPIDANLLEHLNAAIQRTTTIKPKKKRANVVKQNSRGVTIREIEQKIANLDAWQKRAAIEFPEGPQRIRGLAGSGKTIVLAQKASLLHAKYPDWEIVVTFNTRSLYQQFQNLIRRFSFELIRDEPDWNKLKIMHAWGSAGSAGVYSEIAKAHGKSPRDFSYARRSYSYGLAFSGICQELLKEIKEQKPIELFDAVLIDEAQDFPTEFFQLVYQASREPKRIVWAYDELQNLGDYTMPPAEALFGKNDDGTSRVTLANQPEQPQQDIILPVCYRNTPWALATAHSLGFGIYRAEGLVQMFDDTDLWNDIGYEVAAGNLESGKQVVLARRANASPAYFAELMNPQDAISARVFASAADEAEWVAQEIKKNITRDELDYDDILIIVADPISIRSSGARMMRALQEEKITSHLAGVTATRDALFFENSVAITSIHRAKGNEAPMVYVIGTESCFQGFELSRKRNIVFTAITRSRAWVRLSGVGADMTALKAEIDSIFEKNFRLDFRYPTQQQIKKLKRIHRDMSKTEKATIKRDLEGLERTLKRLDAGEISPDSLSANVQELLRALTRPEG
jgi:superfamily I DNA and RNA helicase